MTYLEEYCNDYGYTEKEFWDNQNAVMGFCPRDVDVDYCTHMDLSCTDCWNRQIEETDGLEKDGK